MFGAVDELVPPGKKPLTFMIYFRGKDGWHERKWKSNQEWNADPFLMEFASDAATLRITVDRSSRQLAVFSRQVDLATANVVLVDHVDLPGKEIVTELGRVDLVMPEDANPALWVLENYDSIRAKVLSSQ
jgi:hypothetical protein